MRTLRFCTMPLAFLLAVGSLAAADLPGGITDVTLHTGFLATPERGIDAVDLATGETLWRTTEAQRPLFVWQDRLYALAAVTKKRPFRLMGFTLHTPPPGLHGFCLVGLDLDDDGKRVVQSEVVELPEWVSLPETAGQAFTTRWHLEKDAVILTWEARAKYVGGKRATATEQALAPKHAQGAIRVELRTGDTMSATPDKPRPVAGWPFAQELENLAVRWEGMTGDSYKAVIREEREGKVKLILRSWDAATHKPREAKELIQGKQFVVLPTTDDRFLCVRETLPSPDQNPTEDEQRNYCWTIFAVESGDRIGTMPFDPRMQAVTILDERIYQLIGGPIRGALDRPFQQPRELRAVDLESSKTLWERPLPSKPLLPPG